MKKLLFTLVLSSTFGTVFASQNVLTNGSFETETAAGSSTYYSLSNTAAPDGWEYTPGQYIGGSSYATSNQNFFPAAEDGSWLIDLNAYGDSNYSNPAQASYASLSQAVNTVAGTSYNLSYYLEDYYNTGFLFNATWNGSVISGTQVFRNGVPQSWTLYTATVVGTGTAGGDILGLNIYGGSGPGFLDNVSLVQAQAVPEPNSLLTFGVGIMALAVLRRRRV